LNSSDKIPRSKPETRTADKFQVDEFIPTREIERKNRVNLQLQA